MPNGDQDAQILYIYVLARCGRRCFYLILALLLILTLNFIDIFIRLIESCLEKYFQNEFTYMR